MWWLRGDHVQVTILKSTHSIEHNYYDIYRIATKCFSYSLVSIVWNSAGSSQLVWRRVVLQCSWWLSRGLGNSIRIWSSEKIYRDLYRYVMHKHSYKIVLYVHINQNESAIFYQCNENQFAGFGSKYLPLRRPETHVSLKVLKIIVNTAPTYALVVPEFNFVYRDQLNLHG